MLAFKMWWLAAVTSQTCHGALFHDADSVTCGSAGYVLKEHFCLPFRATLRKLRPEDMFETWVSTCGGNHCVPCHLPIRNCCSRALASGQNITFPSLQSYFLSSGKKGKPWLCCLVPEFKQCAQMLCAAAQAGSRLLHGGKREN